MSANQTFRHYRISQDLQNGAYELWRNSHEVVCLAVDTVRQVFVELHVGISAQPRDHKRFMQVTALAAQLRHQHLLNVLDGGEDEGASYYVTEFVDGERLDTYLARCNPLPPSLALHLADQIAQGLRHIASETILLAGVNLFNSTIHLSGPNTRHLTCKVADLNLTVEPDKAFHHAPAALQRAATELAWLLYYMVTGNMPQSTPLPPELSPLPPELGYLLTALCDPTHAHHPSSVAHLCTLVERCRSEFPPTDDPLSKFPSSARPRLPLQRSFLPGEVLSDVVGNDFQVDPTPFDSLQPYRHAATNRSNRTPVTIQLLPPDRIMAADYNRSLQATRQQINNLDHPNLFRVISYDAETQPEFYVEEASGRLSLQSVLEMKSFLSAVETSLVLEQLWDADRQAQACGLIPVMRAPSHIYFHFTNPGGEAQLPALTELAATSLTNWPAFRLRVRTYPTSLNLTQPELFNAERLLGEGHASLDITSTQRLSSTLTSASSRDYAILATYLTQRNNEVDEKLRQLMCDHLRPLRPSQQPPVKNFIAEFQSLSGRVPTASPTIRKEPNRSKKSRRFDDYSSLSTSAPELQAITEDHDVLVDPPGSFPLGLDSHDYDSEDTAAAPGFAEMLFGDQLISEEVDAPAPARNLETPAADSPLRSPAPETRNFLDGYSDDREDGGLLDAPDFPDEPRDAGITRFLLLAALTVLVAALLAGAAAMISGRARWSTPEAPTPHHNSSGPSQSSGK